MDIDSSLIVYYDSKYINNNFKKYMDLSMICLILEFFLIFIFLFFVFTILGLKFFLKLHSYS